MNDSDVYRVETPNIDREWWRYHFAGMAVGGLMADPNEDGDSETIARKSIAVADALIAALEVKP